MTINRGDIIRILYNSEFDGFPNLGLNADEATGFPIVDPEYANDFYYFDLLGFDIAQMSWKPQPSRTLGRWIEFQHLPESGRVINLAATDWDGDGDFSSSDFILARAGGHTYLMHCLGHTNTRKPSRLPVFKDIRRRWSVSL